MANAETDQSMASNMDAQRFRETLRSVYGVSSMFVRVPTLAKILGINASTIYAAMRERRFCLPHRLVGTAPIVRTDDLVVWYCDAEQGGVGNKNTDDAVVGIPADDGTLIDLTRKAAVGALSKDWRAKTVSRAIGQINARGEV